MIKDPIIRRIQSKEALPCGDVNLEIAEYDGIDVVAGGGTGLWCNGLISYLLGNQGYICTWTVECQSNCS